MVKEINNSSAIEQNRAGLIKVFFVLSSLLILLFVIFVSSSLGAVTNFERVSVGTGSVEGNFDSFYLSLSEDASVVTFESFVSNWAPDQTVLNFVDIFARDRNADVTRKLTVSYGGGSADQRSFDPYVSADGRYISFISYATNLVPDDTNRQPYVDDGLDVFLYDWQTAALKRVSLTWKGEQIDGNSVGQITPNGEYVIFSSNGLDIAPGDSNGSRAAAIYVRHLQTGEVERITKAANGAFPDGAVARAVSSYDGRFIVYISNATNLVPDTNGFADVMLYDRQTGETTLISKPVGGGQANGRSTPAAISADGRYILYRSFATNLVPNDTNGVPDLFVYDRLTGELEMVSVSSTGVQANEDSRDPAICGNGRFISFTSEATNLVPLAHNGQRQVYVHDRVTKTTFLATGTDTFMGNGRAHRSTLSADCSTIGFATQADNLVVGDLNDKRDLFVGTILIPANLEPSTMFASGQFEAGSEVTYTFALKNNGTETAVVTFNSPIPVNTTYLSGSVSGASASYNGSANAVQWTGNIPGEGEVTIRYTVTVNPSLTDFTLIENQTEATYGSRTEALSLTFAVNGLKTFLPLVSR